jgi:hypothetical protein
MAASTILAIYDAIKAVSVTVDSKTPTVKDLDELRANQETAVLPVRLLLPFGNFDASGRIGETRMATIPGNVMRVSWSVRDLLLWRPIAQGEGLYTVADDMVAYAGAYVAAFVNRSGIQRKLTDQAYIDNITATPGIYEYPESGGRFYFGVNCILSVVELIS